MLTCDVCVSELAVNALELQGTMVQEPLAPESAVENGDGEGDGSPTRHDLVVEDEKQQCDTLAALDTMRKNRHFCDVVLNVSHSISAQMETNMGSVEANNNIRF